MGKHFADAELDQMDAWSSQGQTPVEIHRRLQAAHERAGKDGPDLTSVRRALKGQTFRRSRKESRGRHRILSQTNLRAVDRARKKLIKKADGEYEVHWEGYEEPTWEPAANLEGCLVLDEYLASL